MANEHIINNNIVISGSISSSIGFFGDGSGLTSITAVAEWDGTRNGNAEITGSLIVSGASANVDFINTTQVKATTFSGSYIGVGSGLTDLNLNGYQASGSILSGSFSGSYIGNGSGLTGIQIFPFSGSSVITGSLLVSGGLVDLTNATAISGSSFSGSFSGDGSGLTGVPAGEWDGSRNGDGSITGSLDVSGSNISINLRGETTIDKNILISNRGQLLDISIGSGSLPNSTVSRNTLTIGVSAGASLISGSENVYLGNNAGKKGVGTNEDVAVGTNALCNNTGLEIGDSICSGNTAVGHNAMKIATNARQNVALGYQALYAGTPTAQVAIGYDAARLGSGIYGVFIGYQAGITNQGSYNVAVGSKALTGTSSNSVAIGRCSLGFKSGVSNNVAVGHFAGNKVDENSRCNVYIGHRAGPATRTVEDNQLYIGNSASDNSGSLIRGDFRTGQVTVHNQVSASLFSGSFVGDGSGLSGISGAGFPFNGDAIITGSLFVTQSNAASTSVTIEGGHVILSQVSSSLDFTNDTEAAAGGVPIAGLYRNGNFIQIRLN